MHVLKYAFIFIVMISLISRQKRNTCLIFFKLHQNQFLNAIGNIRRFLPVYFFAAAAAAAAAPAAAKSLQSYPTL